MPASPEGATREDPLKTPLAVVATGLAVTMVTIVLQVVMFVMIVRDAPIEHLPDLLSVLSAAADVTVLVGCAMVWRRKRPGATQALVAALCHGGDVAFAGVWWVAGVLSATSAVHTAIALANTVVDVVGVVMLALSLRELARSRGRNFDGWLVGGSVLTALTVLARGADFALGFSIWIYVATSAVALGVRLVLLLVAMTLARTDVLPDAQLAYGSAYRGPTGAVVATVEGSLALGFLAGFFGGCIGAGLVLALAKGAQTKRGAGIGFACQTVLGIGLRAALH